MGMPPVSVPAMGAQLIPLLQFIDPLDIASPLFREYLHEPCLQASEDSSDTATVLRCYCEDFAISPANVVACLQLLETGSVMLHAGSPVLMMGYSRLQRRYMASVDGDLSQDWRMLSTSRAVLLLLLLAAELGELPERRESRAVIAFTDNALSYFSSANGTAASLYWRFAEGKHSELDGHEVRMSRAFYAIRDFMLS